MKNNKGFSMVELIVIIAVLAIIAGVVMGNMGKIVKWNLNKCTEQVDDTLNKIKVMSLSNSTADPSINLSMNGSDFIMNVNGTEIDLGEFDVTVYYENVDRTLEFSSDLANQEITISFNNTGEFNEIAELNGRYLKKIVITKSSYSETIICERLTGKHYIE